MVQYDPDQDYTEVIDRQFDFTDRLGSMVGTPTIATATVTCPTSGVTISNKQVATPKVTYRISSTGISTPTWVNVTCHAACSDGQELDEIMRVHLIDT
jgi:hypothetical protein